MPQRRLGLLFAIVTTVFWGVWMALLNKPVENGFPETMGYVAWSLTMIPPALVALWLAGWRLEIDARSITLGCLAGLLGAGGQLLLFKTVPSLAPGYLVYPFTAINPVVTILLAAVISRERVHPLGWVGVALALVAGVMLNWSTPQGETTIHPAWIVYAIGILMAWGLQGYVISLANHTMKAESIFFYMAITSLALAPVAWAMTPATQSVNWGLNGFGLSLAIQSLNALGALLLVYAYRYGKAMIVAPLTNAGAPALAILLGLALSLDATSLSPIAIAGIVLAIIATVLMGIEEEKSE
ncbi:EamA family transporter [Aeoliella sp. SH292]|uniref:EamA family transporter n=1 Tax=Aeoliella sp. SH292 TaxID=3454464 RepID=UPI003F968EF0